MKSQFSPRSAFVNITSGISQQNLEPMLVTTIKIYFQQEQKKNTEADIPVESEL